MFDGSFCQVLIFHCIGYKNSSLEDMQPTIQHHYLVVTRLQWQELKFLGHGNITQIQEAKPMVM